MKEHYKQIAIALLLIWSISITMAYFTPKKKSVVYVPVKVVTEKEKLISFIKHHETFLARRVKMDGRHYIGYGHQCLNDEFTEPIDSAMADCIVREDFDYCMEQIKGLKLNENQRLAVASFVFNFGYSYFIKSHLYKLLKEDKPITKEWIKHCRYKGKINDGLLQRRIYELYLWNKEKIF